MLKVFCVLCLYVVLVVLYRRGAAEVRKQVSSAYLGDLPKSISGLNLSTATSQVQPLVCLSVCLYLPLPSLSVTFSFCLSLCIHHHRFTSLSLSVCLSLSLSLSLSDFWFLSLCLCVCSTFSSILFSASAVLNSCVVSQLLT